MSTLQLPNMKKKNHPLRIERLQRQWSQRELAERVGATIATVKRWERRAATPSPYFRLKLTALFGKSEEELGLGDANVLPITSPEKDVDEEVQISYTPALWTVPYRRNPYFTGRDDLLHLLNQHLSAGSQEEQMSTRRAALTQP
jgi:transcriptional regulator with XRE-family HTH domain